MTRHRARLAATALLVFAAAGPGAAQTPPTPDQVRAAREVIDASGAADSIKDIVPIFFDEARQTFSRTRPEIAKDLDEVLKALQPEFARRKEALMNEVARTYAERFSAQELNEIKSFYLSSTGVKLVRNLPEILQQNQAETRAWSQKMSQDIVTRLRQEMRKRGHEI